MSIRSISFPFSKPILYTNISPIEPQSLISCAINPILGSSVGLARYSLWYIRAKEVLISSGSIERPIVFGNNDTPGVMLSSAAKEYLKVYGVLVGRNPLIFTNNDSGYETAIEFKKNGVDSIILDTRKDPQSEIVDEAKKLGINIKFSYVVVAAQGYKKVKSADIAKFQMIKNSLER